MDLLVRKISEKIKKSPMDIQAYIDLYNLCHEVGMKKYLPMLAELVNEAVRGVVEVDIELAKEFIGLHKKVLRDASEDNFDCYLQYVEFNRAPQKKFYMPRRKVLKPLVDDLQRLADGELDFLGISLPPRVGKSTLCIFFLTWVMGKRPDVANVMSGHSDKLTRGFYSEVLSIITDKDEYLWGDVFPWNVASTSSKEETIDLCKAKRFSSLTCRSIEGTLTGAVEVGTGGVLYCDDLIEDLEEAINPQRLQAKYDAYLNQLKDRKKDGAFELMVGTRWNVFDPLGRIQEKYADNPRYKFDVIPALNENNESNFDYPYKLGFSTEYYLDMKNSIDDATWNAKYMGRPYIREGLIFPENELNTFNGTLPDGKPFIGACCDVAWGGGDSVAMPIAYVYGEDVYIKDVVFNNGAKDVTYPEVIGKLKIHKPHKVVFEANNGGHEYADNVDKALRAERIKLNISSRRAPHINKLARIIQYAPDIKRFYFLSDAYRSKEYRAFMREVTLLTQNGKNPHDDAPDSLAQLANEINRGSAKAEVFQRPW